MNKVMERATVEAFLKAQSIPLLAVAEWDRERPDFLAAIDGTMVGIEVTYVSEAIPRHQTHPFQWGREARRIAKLAQRAFESVHPDRLVVRFNFRADWTPGAVKAPVLAKGLADAVAASLARGWPYNLPGQAIQWNKAHPSLADLWVNHSTLGEGHWDATFSGNVVAVSPADVRATVARKEHELPVYRTAASHQWLLIDCSVSGQHVAFDVPDPVEITTGFDRVFCTGFGLWRWVEMATRPSAGTLRDSTEAILSQR